MPNKMLIDASHPEETRVVVVRGNRIEEFDFESQSKKQLKGNIYLARVTRVEPSLQAAFVEYGGNRHGFLAFSEIHPDYYQIPVADRQALLAADAAAAEEEDEDSESRQNARRPRKRRSRGRATTQASGSPENGNDDENADSAEAGSGEERAMAASADGETISEPVSSSIAASIEDGHDGDNGEHDSDDGDNGDSDNGDHDDSVELVGASDPLDELPDRGRVLRRQYKIQEVIKRRQIMLVQVVKEERGNKGAALTTYLSLAGRYSVLMPNTARGGGISRKITSAPDRKRLKDIVKELDVPQGMGVILRTAGANRTKAEIKRDYEYLMRLWMRIRTLTLESSAPALVHEEGSLIKRSVRDLYNKDIDQILVAGEESYREAKDFMRMLMPSHAKVVQPYRDKVPIFARNGIEAQLDRMLQPQVTLKSGGYIILNQTEALVAIDVNSGRSTREHSIESTALQTNLEAAEEVARQLRLRDLAGLVVIDFIDMEEKRNNRAVEKRLKDCLKNDRARIQVGRISHFGLLEMSRQRIRSSVLESTMRPCDVCHGTGYIRTDASVALHVLRGIEEYLLKDSTHDVIVRTSTSTALYMLNKKRLNLTELENRFGLAIQIEADDSLRTQHYSIAKGELSTRIPAEEPAFAPPVDEIEPEIEEIAPEPVDEAEEKSATEEGNGRKKRRRRRRRGGHGRDGETSAEAAETAVSDVPDEEADNEQAAPSLEAGETADLSGETSDTHASDAETQQQKKRRRGRRGGQRSRAEAVSSDMMAEPGEPAVAESAEADRPTEPVAAPETAPAELMAAESVSDDSHAAAADVAESAGEAPKVEAEAEAETSPAPRKKPAARKPRTRKTAAAKAAEEAKVEAAEAAETADTEATGTPAADEPKPEVAEPEAAAPEAEEVATQPEPVVIKIRNGSEDEVVADSPKKEGWWKRRGFF